MNDKPLTRRRGFIILIGLGLIAIPYYLLISTSGESVHQPTILSSLGLLAGLLLSIGACGFILSLLMGTRDTRSWLTTFLRLLFFVVLVGLYLLTLIGMGTPILRTFLSHLGLALLTLLFMIILTAQFVLPVRARHERLGVIRRLVGFLAGEGGQVTFIRNGEVIEAQGERKRSGLGVLLIDYASAAVLRTDVEFTRAVGPGLVFTDIGERIEEAVDLRRQIRSVDGFVPPTGEAASLESVNSLAVTKDGIPVSTDLKVQFLLDPGEHVAPHEGRIATKPPYPWKEDAIEKSVYGHAFGEGEDLPWTELPLRLTIELWREIVKEKTLKDLTTFKDDGEPPLERIRADIFQRLVTPEDESQVDTTEPNGSNHREWKILQSRGIRVVDVGVSYLYLPDDVHHERMEGWRQEWVSEIQTALADAQDKADRAAREGEVRACELLFEQLTGTLFDQILKGSPPNKRDTLRCILRDAVELCSQEEKIEEGANLTTHLLDIARELATLDKDCHQMSGES
ncbi:MAG: hypothetical protein GTO14_21270 [Anaerolineales bacterium]|nr:hypothetical protein [Anaerolineales bacterium]